MLMVIEIYELWPEQRINSNLAIFLLQTLAKQPVASMTRKTLTMLYLHQKHANLHFAKHTSFCAIFSEYFKSWMHLIIILQIVNEIFSQLVSTKKHWYIKTNWYPISWMKNTRQ